MAKTAERTKTKTAKKASPKKSTKKSEIKKKKPDVKNSLVNNINAKKKKGTSRSKKNQLYHQRIIKTWKIIGKKRSETDVGMKLDLQPFNSTKN